MSKRQKSIVLNKIPSERDKELVTLRVDGASIEQIAEYYDLSVRTIESYFDSMRREYGVKNVYALIGLFFRNGLIK